MTQFVFLKNPANLINHFPVYRKVQLNHKIQPFLKSQRFTNEARLSGPSGLQSVVQGGWLCLSSGFEGTLNKLEQAFLPRDFNAPLALRGVQSRAENYNCLDPTRVDQDANQIFSNQI